MTGGKNGPFSNQDAVVAVGLAFAGMAVLQSKLFPAIAGISGSPWLSKLLDCKVFGWWPVLLIVVGVWLWLQDRSAKRWRKNARSIAQSGGSK
jgi:hypothetical protein